MSAHPSSALLTLNQPRGVQSQSSPSGVSPFKLHLDNKRQGGFDSDTSTTPALGKCPLWFEPISGGQNSRAQRDPSQMLTCVSPSMPHLHPIKFSHKHRNSADTSAKSKRNSISPRGGEKDDSDTQSFFSLIFLCLPPPPLSVCRSRGVRCLSAQRRGL